MNEVNTGLLALSILGWILTLGFMACSLHWKSRYYKLKGYEELTKLKDPMDYFKYGK